MNGWPTPLKNDGLRQLVWLFHSQYMESPKIPWFQTTNQIWIIMDHFSIFMSWLKCSPKFGYGYPLVNIQKTMERSTIFDGKIHYGPFSRANFVCLPGRVSYGWGFRVPKLSEFLRFFRLGGFWEPWLQISWLVVFHPTPLKNDGLKVSWDDDIPFPTEWQVIKFHGSKPPTRYQVVSYYVHIFAGDIATE